MVGKEVSLAKDCGLKHNAVPMRKETPLISVIIPAYNNGQFLREALSSVFAQGMSPEIEIIVVNDGSTDNTAEIIRGYGSSLIYVEQKNSGPAAARNAGVALAGGEYIAFLDADDVWAPTKLEEQMRIFSLRPEAALVYCQFESFGQSYDVGASPWPKKVYSGRLFDKLLVESFIPLPSVVIKTSVIRALGGFDEDLLTAEDTNLWIRVARSHEIAGIEKALVKRRLHGNNLSERVDIHVGTLDNLDRVVRLFPDTEPSRCPQMKKAYVSRGTELVKEYFYKSQYAKCHETCKRIRAVSPYDGLIFRYWLATLLGPALIERLRKMRRSVR